MIFEHLGGNVLFVYNSEYYMFSNFLHNFNFLEKLPLEQIYSQYGKISLFVTYFITVSINWVLFFSLLDVVGLFACVLFLPHNMARRRI